MVGFSTMSEPAPAKSADPLFTVQLSYNAIVGFWYSEAEAVLTLILIIVLVVLLLGGGGYFWRAR
jgi:hypothetical protein